VSDERPPKLWREELKRAYLELRGARVTPLRGALSVALGLWVGSIPAFGLHTPVVLALCLWLRLDGLLAWVASNVSNPFFAPFLVMGEVQVGALVMTGAPLDYFDVSAARQTGVSGVVLYAFAGAPFVATAIALVGGVVVYVAVYLSLLAYRGDATPVVRPPYTLPSHAPRWWSAAERMAARFAPEEVVGKTRFHVTRIRLVTDPRPARWAEHIRPRAKVSVVGTDAAWAALALLELGAARSARARDPAAASRERAARAAAVAPPLPLEVDDVEGASIPPADAVLLLEVSPSTGHDLLIAAAQAVGPGGRLLLEAKSGRVASLWSWLGGRRQLTHAASAIEATGFTTQTTSAGFGRVLIIARRT